MIRITDADLLALRRSLPMAAGDVEFARAVLACGGGGMRDDTETGGSAFPAVELDRVTGSPCDQHLGMTLRDYFAAKALPYAWQQEDSPGTTLDQVANRAYEIADAMIRARSGT